MKNSPSSKFSAVMPCGIATGRAIDENAGRRNSWAWLESGGPTAHASFMAGRVPFTMRRQGAAERWRPRRMRCDMVARGKIARRKELRGIIVSGRCACVLNAVQRRDTGDTGAAHRQNKLIIVN
jgi:hypothetical protein